MSKPTIPEQTTQMARRTIKPAAGQSRVTAREATSAARIVRRDTKSGRFVMLDQGSGLTHPEAASGRPQRKAAVSPAPLKK